MAKFRIKKGASYGVTCPSGARYVFIRDENGIPIISKDIKITSDVMRLRELNEFIEEIGIEQVKNVNKPLSHSVLEPEKKDISSDKPDTKKLEVKGEKIKDGKTKSEIKLEPEMKSIDVTGKAEEKNKKEEFKKPKDAKEEIKEMNEKAMKIKAKPDLEALKSDK